MPAKKKLTARITHLEMAKPVHKTVHLPTRPKVALLEVGHMPLSFYRYVYAEVGRDHHWFDRREIDDSALDDIINDEATQIEVLYAEGCPAGFFELDLTELPECVKIVYFGLSKPYQGLGLGRWFLSQAIEKAWRSEPKKITVNTNTLDHPAALLLYQKMGFQPVGTSEEIVTAWE